MPTLVISEDTVCWQGYDLTVRVLFSRAGLATQVLVEAGGTRFLVDAGDGTVRDLLRANVAPQSLTGVFLTHGHQDHVGGLYALLGFLRAEGHNSSFTVWFPADSCEARELVEAIRRCYQDIPYPLQMYELKVGETVVVGRAEVTAWPTVHWHSIQGRPLAPAPALGYRITFAGQTVAITGDTAFHPGLEDMIRGVDLALIEATLDDEAPELQKANLHLTLSSARRLAQLAKAAVLIHRPDGRLLVPGHNYE